MFYPDGTRPGDYLACYADHFPGVEVDSTYYGIPRPRTVEAWATATPAGFVFSPKMFGEVTHQRFLQDTDDLLAQYLDVMAPLGEKLGPIVLQFPYYKKADGVSLEGFLGRLLPFLDRLDAPNRFAVEIRNKTFLKPPLLDALRQRSVPLVLIDHVWMPHPRDLLGRADELFTAGTVPIRLLGDRYNIERQTKTWDRTVVDCTERLNWWAQIVRYAMAKGLPVSAFANNHYEGHAPSTAQRLGEFVSDADRAGEPAEPSEHSPD